MVTVVVVVPAGMVPGQMIKVQTPVGTVKVAIPASGKPGRKSRTL